MEEATPPVIRCSLTKACHGELTNFPIRHGPSISHPVGDIREPIPRPLRRRDGVEIGIGGLRGLRKTAGLLTDLEAEVRQAASELAYMTGLDSLRLGGNWRLLLAVELFFIARSHGGREWDAMVLR